jgi:hypothetical protein
MTARDQSEDAETPLGVRILARLTENWSLKVISLVIALAVYVVLHSGGDQQRTIDIDVNQAPLKDGSKILLTNIPSRVRVTVRGPRALIEDIPTIDSIDVDLNGEPTTVHFDTASLKLPPGLQKVGVAPPYIHLRWDTKVQKRVKVEPSTSQPPEGLQLKNLTVSPDTAVIAGPKSRIDTIQKLHTTILDLKDRVVGTHLQKLAVDVSADADPNMVKTDLEFVEARFELVPETKTRTFLNIPVLAMKGKGVTLRPRNVSVVVTCPPKRTDELTAEAIVPKIDLELLGPDFAKKGPEDADVKVELAGCSEISVSPPRVTITR